MSNPPAVTTNTGPNSATHDRARVLERLRDLEREQSHAESMLLGCIVRVGDPDVAMNALEEARRGGSRLHPPVGLNSRTMIVLGAVLDLLKLGSSLSVANIADYMRLCDNDPPMDYIARVCGIALDTGEYSPFAYARKVGEVSAARWELGQRVWPEALYRWYDWDDRLLYIGITRDLAARQEAHSKNSSWGRFANCCTVQRYPTRETVEIAERWAIKQEQPLFNHVHNDTPEARHRLVEYLVDHGHLDLLAPTVSRG